LLSRLREPRKFILVLAGPRQVGKTTLARQVMEAGEIPSHYASADAPTLRDRTWIEQQWDLGRLRAGEGDALLVLDEIQKIGEWSEVVKRLWDEDTASGKPLKVAILGSAPLLVRSGLTESLAGRFEILPMTHWSFGEMREAFGWDVERYVYFGGYPGAAGLTGDRNRWSRPKLQVLNTALMTAQSPLSFEEARRNRDYWGRLVESAVGAHLHNSSAGAGVEISYWRDRGKEVDFILRSGKSVVALEVKSSRRKESLPGAGGVRQAVSRGAKAHGG
jgi:predicted AAA+ superfamily ATPase